MWMGWMCESTGSKKMTVQRVKGGGERERERHGSAENEKGRKRHE